MVTKLIFQVIFQISETYTISKTIFAVFKLAKKLHKPLRRAVSEVFLLAPPKGLILRGLPRN